MLTSVARHRSPSARVADSPRQLWRRSLPGALLAGCGNLSTAKQGSEQACAALAAKEPLLTPMFTVADANATIAQAEFALGVYQLQSDEIRAQMNSSQTQLLDRVVRAMAEYQSALAARIGRPSSPSTPPTWTRTR